VVSTGSYVVNSTVSSSSVSQIQDGDQATITPSGATTPVYGTVGSIGVVANDDIWRVVVPVVVNVTGSPTGLFGGTSANVSIIVKELQNVVVVPSGAITYTGDHRGHARRRRKKVTQPVTIGIASGTDTQIVSGVGAGQKIYVTSVSFRGPLGPPRTGGRTGRLRWLSAEARRLRRRHGGFGGCTGGFGGGTGGSADDTRVRRTDHPGSGSVAHEDTGQVPSNRRPCTLRSAHRSSTWWTCGSRTAPAPSG